MEDVFKKAYDSAAFKLSLMPGDLLINEASETIVEFVQFREHDGYLFWGKIIESTDPGEIGQTKRNFYTHKFKRHSHPL